MTAVLIEVDEQLHASISRCIAERDAGIALAAESDRSGWNSALIDQAIDHFAATGMEFSANDVRILLPDDLPGPLFGNRFSHARKNRGVIKVVGFLPSSKPNTHGKGVYVYVGTNPDRPA